MVRGSTSLFVCAPLVAGSLTIACTSPTGSADPSEELRGRCAGTTGLHVPVPTDACDRVTAQREPLCGWEIVAEDGRRARIDDGMAFLWDGASWTPLERVYDPSFFDASYRTSGCEVSRVLDDGTAYPIPETFVSEFAGFTHVRDLIGLPAGYGAFTLQSPAAPTIPDYVALMACIRDGSCDFRDNRIDIVPADGATGGMALRCEAVPPSPGMITSKASIETHLAHFVSGDHAWLTARIIVEAGQPTGIFDLESSWLVEYPGPRVLVADDGVLEVELKWGNKPTYRPTGTRVPLPHGQWVRITLELVLDATDGEVRLYQDGELLIDARGANLPLPNTILNSFEIGIPANGHTGESTVVLVDSVRAAHTPPPEL